MRRFAGGLLCVGALLASGVLASPAAATKPNCASFRVGSSHETNEFTHIKLVNVSCTLAHQVLRKWATIGSGGTHPVFVCADEKTSTKNVYAVKCATATKVITARDKFNAR
jgi:hypothetical protein